MGMLPASASRPQVAAALEATMGPSVQPGSPAMQLGPLMASLLAVAYKFRFHLPSYYTLVMRSLTSLEGIALSVDPTFYVFEATYPFVLRRFISDPHPTVREALRSLLFTPAGQVKWERVDEVAPYFTKFSDAARAAVAQETGDRGAPEAEAPDGGAEDSASVGKILLSRKARAGATLRCASAYRRKSSALTVIASRLSPDPRGSDMWSRPLSACVVHPSTPPPGRRRSASHSRVRPPERRPPPLLARGGAAARPAGLPRSEPHPKGAP